jgi:CO/xanthine dehydrogenase Mo-binding subunit
VIVGASIAKGRVRSIDVAAATTVPGVLTVLTNDNAPRLAERQLQPTALQDRTLQVLQDDEVRYDGQPIAVVVAETIEQARHAAGLVSPKYEVGTPVVAIEAELRSAYAPKETARGPTDTKHGDFDSAFRADATENEARKALSCRSFGAQFCEAHVDELTGEIRVSRVVSAFAAGRILNAKTARGQLLGGIVWGISLALLENTVRDVRDGRVVTKELQDYHVPVDADVPAIDVITVDEVDPHVSAVGAKGIGELGIVGIGAAIANAVFHATGKRVRDLPITLDKLI